MICENLTKKELQQKIKDLIFNEILACAIYKELQLFRYYNLLEADNTVLKIVEDSYIDNNNETSVGYYYDKEGYSNGAISIILNNNNYKINLEYTMEGTDEGYIYYLNVEKISNITEINEFDIDNDVLHKVEKETNNKLIKMRKIKKENITHQLNQYEKEKNNIEQKILKLKSQL